ncbi:MAG: hypothetical protein WCJ61_14220, partial [Paludibacter sp.]
RNSADPDQVKNVLALAEYKNDLKNFRKILSEWMDQTGDDIPQNLTKDWYTKDSETVKMPGFGIRGDMPGTKRLATQNNHKGKF